MSRQLSLLAALLLLAGGCAQHSQAWDDAWAKCQAEALEQMEVTPPKPDQRSTWQDNYIRECMQKAGFAE